MMNRRVGTLIVLTLIVTILASTSIFISAASQLDYGMYWFTSDNVAHKFLPNQPTPGYNHSNPTIIFVHGWAKGETKINYREDFFHKAPEWINKGYNVGVFYWNQFADEDEIKDAESKIHVGNGPRGMRWRMADNSYSTFSTDKSAAELFCEEYMKAMAGYSGNDIRIVGHSVGSQMAVELAFLARNKADQGLMPRSIIPSRVALLDPFFSKGEKSYLNKKWTGEIIREHVKDLRDNNGIVFESYRSSLASGGLVGDSNPELQRMCTYSELVSDHIPTWDIKSKHLWALNYYFSSLNVTSTNQPLASTSHSEMDAKMRGNKYWKQSGGKTTADLSDDVFITVNW